MPSLKFARKINCDTGNIICVFSERVHNLAVWPIFFSVVGQYSQWLANPDLDLNPDLTTFAKSGGFGLDLNFFIVVDLDLSFFKVVDLDLNIAGFGFERFQIHKSTSFKVIWTNPRIWIWI